MMAVAKAMINPAAMKQTRRISPNQHWLAAGHSHAGGAPETKTPSALWRLLSINGRPLCIAMVADGVGGENAGDWASRTAIAAVQNYIHIHAAEVGVRN